MFAVFESGGKQHRVEVGDLVTVEKLDSADTSVIEFDRILLVENDDGVSIGDPLVANAKVVGEVIGTAKARKITGVKFKRRKNYLRRFGHRQQQTTVRITSIAT